MQSRDDPQLASNESAWENAPTSRKLIIRGLQVFAVISGLISLVCAYWVLEPALQRVEHNPLVVGSVFVAGVIAVNSWLKARDMKYDITKRP